MVGPHAGEAVGLQFHAHRQRIRLGLGDALALAVDLAGDAQQVLHVVADLVGDHVGLGEFAADVEARLQPSALEDQRDHRRRGGLAVRACHGDATSGVEQLAQRDRVLDRAQAAFPCGA